MRTLLRLKPYLAPYKWYIVGSLLLAIPLAGLRFSVAPFVNVFVNDLLGAKDPSKVWQYPLIFIGIYLLNFVVRLPHYYLLRVAIARVNQRLKNELYEHLVGLSADHFSAQSTGTLMSRVTTDTQYVDSGLYCLNVLIREPITFLMLFGYALSLNWRLTLIMVLILPPLAWVFSSAGRNLKRYITRMQEENAKLFSTLQESFVGIRVIHAFRLEKYARRKFRERSEGYTRFMLKTALLEEAAHPLVELLTALAIAGVLYYGGHQVLKGTMTPGDLVAFCAAFALMMNPLRQMNEVNMRLSAASAACARIFEIFDWRTRLVESPNPRPMAVFKSAIEFDRVRFAYPDAPEREVLRGVSFRLEHGGTLALVGESGSGKSSAANLIPRVFDVSSGAVRIDGVDIRELDLNDLRRQIAVVSQDVFLFNDTIEENIRCGRLNASADEIREAARRAHASDFIDRMPQGYGTFIGDRGQRLSGGERQRISIARAFLRDAPILILDEATSSLDAASERAVQEAIDELMKNKTTLIIAHRLSTVQSADHILVVRDGEIVERGHHDELVKSGGEYARFHGAG